MRGKDMLSFEQLCKKYDDVNILKRGGQKVVFSAKDKQHGKCFFLGFWNC